MNRNKIIIRTSIIGILANVFLAAFKAVVGFFTNSIAISLDAVNNLSDALSSVITIIGTKLAGRRPDKKHPFGHGRIEYLSAVTISVIVLYAGISALVESIKKIITPEAPDYTPVALIIVAVAVLVKIVLGTYVRRTGVKVKSDSLVASGKDALLDSVISASTLVAAGIYLIWGISLEAWLGAVISLIIIKSGIDMLREGVSSIVGERVDSELTNGIKETILKFEDVRGVYDLILHNYGPDSYIGSVHIELPDTYTMNQLDRLERDIADAVYCDHKVILAGIGIYSACTDGGKAEEILTDIRKTVMKYQYVLQLHGFSFNEDEKEIRFDLVIDFAAPDRNALYQQIVSEVQNKYPDFSIRENTLGAFSNCAKAQLPSYTILTRLRRY